MARVLSSSFLAAAGAIVMLAGCAGGDPSGGTAPATAVAGESFGTAVPKPLGDTSPSGAPGTGAVPASASTVPSIVGKVRYGVPAAAVPGVGTSLGGALPFPIDDAWNRDLVRAVPDRASASLIAAIGPNATLAPGFGALAGVPYAVVGRGQPAVPVTVDGLPSTRAWPIPSDLQPSADGSARLAVVDRDAGLLHELAGASRRVDGGWDATWAATWRLDVADAAPLDSVGTPPADGGAPVFPGLVRFDEAEAGAIRHALRVTVPAVGGAFVPPARRAAAASPDGSLPPVGLRLRLKAEVAIPPDASPAARAILQALKTYGMIVVGAGPALTLEGVPDARWDAARIAADLARLRGADFEAISMDGLVVASN